MKAQPHALTIELNIHFVRLSFCQNVHTVLEAVNKVASQTLYESIEQSDNRWLIWSPLLLLLLLVVLRLAAVPWLEWATNGGITVPTGS